MCPQTLYKLHPTFDKVLADILSTDQCGTIMMLHGTSEKWDLAVIKRIADAVVAAAGLVPRHALFAGSTPTERVCEALVQVSPLLDRLVLGPQRGHNAFLELLAMADVVVDTHPFGAQLRAVGCCLGHQACRGSARPLAGAVTPKEQRARL